MLKSLKLQGKLFPAKWNQYLLLKLNNINIEWISILVSRVEAVTQKRPVLPVIEGHREDIILKKIFLIEKLCLFLNSNNDPADPEKIKIYLYDHTYLS